MRGWASVRGQSSWPLTPALSPLKRGEGELRVPLELNFPRVLRRELRVTDERRAERHRSFGGRIEARGFGQASLSGRKHITIV
jgi:hypothetical protein